MEETIMREATPGKAACRGLLMCAALTGALGLIAAPTVLAQGATTSSGQVAAAGAQPAEYDPSVWVGRNISAVVKTFGQPSSWNANHEGGGGGSRYFYNNPNQPHFVLETQPGGMIVRAVRLP
jgi:hypothetical protein